MAVKIKCMKKTWKPANVQANETVALFPVITGDIVLAAACHVKTAFNGTTPAAKLGDGNATDRFLTAAQTDIANTGLKSGCGANVNVGLGHYIYPVNDTIDVVYTKGAADGSTGEATFAVWILKTEPF